MAYLAVPHILVRGQAHCRAVGLELGIELGFKKPIEMGTLGEVDGITLILLAYADTIHDNQKKRALPALKCA
jgi:hypothetical protein